MPRRPRHPVLLPLIDRLRRAEPGDTVWIPQLQPGRESPLLSLTAGFAVACVALGIVLEVATALSVWGAVMLFLVTAGTVWVLAKYGAAPASAAQVLTPKATEGWEWDAQTRTLTRWLPGQIPMQAAATQKFYRLVPAQDWSLGVMQGSQNPRVQKGRSSWVLELRHLRQGPVAVLSEWTVTHRDTLSMSDLDWYVDLLSAQLQIRRSGGRLAARPPGQPATIDTYKE